MRQELRPYVITGIAAVGAGLIAVTPITPSPTHIHVPDIALTTDSALLTNPYVDIFTTTFADIAAIVAQRVADPAPILSAVLDNLIGYVDQVLADPSSIVEVPGEIVGHWEDVFVALTTLLTMNPDFAPTTPTLDILFGVPVALLIGGLSPLLLPLGAVEDIVADVTSGDPITALTALIDAPATLINAFLAGLFRPDMGQTATVTADMISQWNTVLAELGQPTLTVTAYDATFGGLGGLVQTLVNYVPEQIAAAISGQPQPEIIVNPIVALLDHLSGLSAAASEFPSTLAAEFSAQLPALLLDPLSLIPF